MVHLLIIIESDAIYKLKMSDYTEYLEWIYLQ